MKPDDLCTRTLEETASDIAARRLSPVEVTRAVLQRIERVNPRLNAYLTVMADQALADAEAAEREIAGGRYRGPLHGIPVGVKDLFATAGVRTTAGSKILADWVPDYDATVVTQLRDAGAVILGKLGLHEWAFGTTSANVHFGVIRNPWDVKRVPGGSSGGSGAAVSAGLAFAAMGSDTGGSIRIPASLCGNVGLMPTYGRSSLYGAVPLSWSMDHPGPLARTVRDAAIVLQATSGRDARDPATKDQPVPDFLAQSETGPKGLRVGVPRQHFWDGLNPDVERLVRAAASELADAGAEVREIDWPDALRYTIYSGTIIIAEAAAYHAENFKSRRADYSDQVAGLLEAGAAVKVTTYIDAMRVMQEARGGAADAALDGVDVLLTPTLRETAAEIDSVKNEDAGRTAFMSLVDLTGQPAISVPCGLTAGGLPVGVQLIARQWDEATLIRAARAYELVRGPFPLPEL